MLFGSNNAVRIYSPVKQAMEQDPDGTFIRQYVPELECVSAEHLAEPHKMPLSTQVANGCRIGKDYPAPIVQHSSAYRLAQSKMQRAIRSLPASESREVLRKHGSRATMRRRRKRW